ncbi:secreted cyanophycinase [Pseudoalteromonas sp. BSi20652]|uniref:cyanophycinase n=1 Tax=Pseudoalteromonas sp. BSi20652 TaxID=388384 RepID=UPI0002317B3D|nr:cyanophycinase [Pseudoalteromonas sp. BSi20652]GAA60474.1 secreted cyanophycinase [Pseudoalteromonas sp. BSi20652]
MRILFQLSMRTRFLFALLPAFISLSIGAQEQGQTLILAGSAFSVCTSESPVNCERNKQINGKKYNLYNVTSEKIKQIKLNWPSDQLNNQKNNHKNELVSNTKNSKKPISKGDLLWLWRDINNESLNSLSDHEYNFVLDILEVFQNNKTQINTTLNTQSSANSVIQFVSGSLNVNSKKPTMLVVTASSRDPYSKAHVAVGLLKSVNINAQWLALTPALVHGITNNTCNKLPILRQTQMNLYNRDAIYPELTRAELALCENGTQALVSLINNSTGVMFNDGDERLIYKILFDQNNNPYPWTQALRSRPVILGEGAGATIQSKVMNTLTNITSLMALRKSENNTNAGGLGSFNFGVLDTQFSERNRTFRLAAALNKNEVKSTKAVIQHGFGIDENTALVVIKSPEGSLMTVVGKSGVVHLANQSKVKPESKSYGYSYWPTGSVINITNNMFTLSERTIDEALPAIKIPPLPVQRFGSILTNSKLRSLTQAMCLSQEQSAVAQQDEFIISLTATSDTQYHRVNAKEFGCAVSNLELAIKSI